MSTLEFNDGWQDQLKHMVEGHMDTMTSNLQQAYDGVLATCQGKPIDEVKAALSVAVSNANPGASITDPELTQYAEYIQNGQRVEFRNGGITD